MWRRILMVGLSITVAACSGIETETGLTSDVGVEVSTIVELDGGSIEGTDVSTSDATAPSDAGAEPDVVVDEDVAVDTGPLHR
jgi:hypothetical protein